MNFIQEYSLLIAVATPVLVIVAIQVWLFMKGERGTLLLPSLRPFPSVDISNVAIAREPVAVAAENGRGEEMIVAAARLVEVERRAEIARIAEAEHFAEEAA
jgi:hypothetical protein